MFFDLDGFLGKEVDFAFYFYRLCLDFRCWFCDLFMFFFFFGRARNTCSPFFQFPFVCIVFNRFTSEYSNRNRNAITISKHTDGGLAVLFIDFSLIQIDGQFSFAQNRLSLQNGMIGGFFLCYSPLCTM